MDSTAFIMCVYVEIENLTPLVSVLVATGCDHMTTSTDVKWHNNKFIAI